ncbi:uncharacterized protein CC84DRAFT_1204102 [Paraphaeosphaeria sporulosa]|uniref:Altered inheritance of mitochondria protein 6 n=1 Tax=Paraphaeosphaeria sporulosa TaxID=1460663 RepID=A0A177CPP2_9PLEO|nr:uncharacterized protein CC84DRAFT_1204102 [Paraphaeosphaeria sporulosa]OAG08850.1 hypothetical protein CC84DRAFT_1204102 [Paraphaeosphaeria sporulosa]
MFPNQRYFAFLLVPSALALPAAQAQSNYISSCGPDWMAINDVKTNHGTVQRVGYNTAVDSFCNKAGGVSVGAGAYTSMATRVWLDYGSNPETTGLNGWVYFEIHNKQSSTHLVNAESCKQYLKKLSENTSGNSCYGPGNKDTKGGTWQVGSDAVSYHALANKFPPNSDSVDKIVTQTGAISALGDGGKGNTLDPFPTYAFNDVTPFACHSHNDYTRDKALYSALSAGCISVEADIWVHSTKLVVGHTDSGSNGQTFVNLYVNPLKKLIDERKAVFPTKPDQPLSLLIDFKNSGSDADKAWDQLVADLQPLRDAGYLSHYDGSFKQGLVTIVATGNAIKDLSSSAPSPIAKALSDATNPQHAIFVDAVIHKDMSRFDSSNAYYASAKWSDAVPKGLPISGDSKTKLDEAHSKGFKVRYWDIPGKDSWQQIVDSGVDRLNVDDLQYIAGLDW